MVWMVFTIHTRVNLRSTRIRCPKDGDRQWQTEKKKKWRNGLISICDSLRPRTPLPPSPLLMDWSTASEKVTFLLFKKRSLLLSHFGRGGYEKWLPPTQGVAQLWPRRRCWREVRKKGYNTTSSVWKYIALEQEGHWPIINQYLKGSCSPGMKKIQMFKTSEWSNCLLVQFPCVVFLLRFSGYVFSDIANCELTQVFPLNWSHWISSLECMTLKPWFPTFYDPFFPQVWVRGVHMHNKTQ